MQSAPFLYNVSVNFRDKHQRRTVVITKHRDVTVLPRELSRSQPLIIFDDNYTHYMKCGAVQLV